MYLINTETLLLEYFQSSSDVVYGILSHRWGKEEITYQDVQKGVAATKQGCQKVVKACEQASKAGLGYMWVDTCCIDKTSSAELSEAINSMYNWYQGAKICYAYLMDVSALEGLEYSDWFTRGWTLQELIAPATIEFYTYNWTKLGTKSSLVDKLSHITSVPVAVLDGREKPRQHSVARRMSWAARRITTRLEDRAYSLIGIFDINMPLLYGEGARAFIRLQEEIIRQTDDQSIFAWHLIGEKSECDGSPSGLLAKSLDAFADCSRIARLTPALELSTFAMTNRGLSIRLPLLRWSYADTVAFLNCVEHASNPPKKFYTVGIFVRQLEEPGQYARTVLYGQDRILFHADCFVGNQIILERDLKATQSIFSTRTAQGPMVYEASWNGRASRKSHKESFNFVAENLYFRQTPLDSGVLTPRRMFGFRLRRFTPYQIDSDFDPEKDFSIRCWNTWDHKERLAVIPTGCLGDACWIYVKQKRVRKLKSSVTIRNEDAKSEQDISSMFDYVDMPSLLLLLGFTSNDEWQFRVALISKPAEKDVATIMSDWRPDAHVLGNPLYTPGGKLPDCIKTYSQTTSVQDLGGDRMYRIFITKEMVNGVEENIVDVLWVGAEFLCDECGKVLRWSQQYCCISCSSPKYDCCLNCFKSLPKSGHDSNPENKQHRFRDIWDGRFLFNNFLSEELKRRLL